MMGASLRFFEVELEVEGVGLEVEGTGFMLEGVNFKLERVSFKVCGTGFEVERTGFEVEQASFMLEEVSFKLEESFKCEGTAFELEEAGLAIRFFEEVYSATVSAVRRRFFCFFSLVSYNPIIASALYQYPRTREGTYRVNSLTIFNGPLLLLLGRSIDGISILNGTFLLLLY